MKVGDLVRYRHDKNRMGLVVLIEPTRVGPMGTPTALVEWLRPCSGKSRWRVEFQYIEVKGKGRFGWRDANENR